MPRFLKVFLSAIHFSLLAAPVVAGDVEAGRLLYQYGTLSSGEEVEAYGFADTEIRGETAACIQCHRRSGFGSYEGGYYVPPVTEAYLFGGRQISRDDRFRALFMQAQSVEFRHQVRRIRDREPYTIESLGTVLREGTDPNGRELERLMPRYPLSDTDLANLYAYLQTLSVQISPGVDQEYLHLATVVHEDVDADDLEAMLGTMESFVDWYNTRTLGDLRLAGHSVYGSSLYTRYSRLFKLHRWELRGPPQTWAEQLESLLDQQPVFAMVSGLTAGPWSEVAQFAERHQIPTIFPITELPATPPALGGYSVYFSRGWFLEADLILAWLEEQEAAGPIWQVIDDGSHAGEVAAYLADRIQGRRAGIAPRQVSREQLHAGGECRDGESGLTGSLIVWSRAPDADELNAWRQCLKADRILMPAAAASAPGLEQLDQQVEVRFSFPFALETEYYPERFRARAWMNTRGLDFDSVTVQFKAYYAMSMFRDSIRHLLDHYHRDYLLEVLEHQIQGSPNPGLYPDMELSPRQRFTSRSGYIVRLDPNGPGGVATVSPRMIP